MITYLGKLSKTKIKDILFNCLIKYGFHPININVLNGYFILDLGKNSVVHFNIKEIPYWKFGFWILTDKEKKEYTIEFFGGKIDWIDKFKPSRCTISSSKYDEDEVYYKVPFVITKTNQPKYCDVDSAIHSVLNELVMLKVNRRIAEYALEQPRQSFIKWLWSEIWYYDIKKPLTEYYEKNIQGKLYNICLSYLGLKYRKYIKIRPIRDMTEAGWYSYPRYEGGVEYLPDVKEEDCNKIWHEIDESKLVKFMNTNCDFQQFLNSEDKKGFYYG